MTESNKKYITGAAVLHALADGKRVRNQYASSDHFVQVREGCIRNVLGEAISPNLDGLWEIVEEPATDAKLIAEMRRRAAAVNAGEHGTGIARGYNAAADMLEARSLTGRKP